jgi:hypothetical protein
MKIAELLASGRLPITAGDIRKAEITETRNSMVPESGIWSAYPGGGEIESDGWVQPLAVPRTSAPAVGSTTPKRRIAATVGSIVCLGDLDVAEAADLAAPGGIERLVTKIARSLRRAEADVVVTSLGLDHLTLQIQQEGGVSNAILASKTEVLALERRAPRNLVASDGRPGKLRVPNSDEREVEAALESLGVNPTRPLVRSSFAEYGWVNVSGLGRVSFLIVADAPLSARPRWVLVFVWMNGTDERATLEALFHDLAEWLGLAHYGKLSALDKGRLALSAAPT